MFFFFSCPLITLHGTLQDLPDKEPFTRTSMSGPSAVNDPVLSVLSVPYIYSMYI